MSKRKPKFKAVKVDAIPVILSMCGCTRGIQGVFISKPDWRRLQRALRALRAKGVKGVKR